MEAHAASSARVGGLEDVGGMDPGEKEEDRGEDDDEASPELVDATENASEIVSDMIVGRQLSFLVC